MKDIVVDISISSDEYLKSYRHSGAVCGNTLPLGEAGSVPRQYIATLCDPFRDFGQLSYQL